MWLKILRQNLSHLARRAKGTASIEQKNANTKTKTNNNGIEITRNEENGTIDIKSQKKKTSSGPGHGPLLQQAEMSSSQIDFFRMLDEKIENGPDYDESLDAVHRAERISDLLRQWELASMTWSSVTDINNIEYITKTDDHGIESIRYMSAKDREGMRNIIGGRPECAPVFVRNANRVDGLEEILLPPQNMPRHVLESISQSPTQTFKNTTSPGTSPTNKNYHNNHDYNTQKLNNNYSQNNTNTQFVNNDYVTQQAIYREQYLQQTGIIAVQPAYQSPNTLRNNTNYVQQFQMSSIPTNQQHFNGRKRAFDTAQMT
ncbi:uncharacterized protein LOC122860204 isoform X2 [Aphidius gifuensis]|uniref:uncharacterized protein LOC122860204 isoform X2 n=1 Tax=Aphidius gifuensis TaxID=684658 RepID=UPI001CDD8855|nr:uncharacterized protein LOC122860204 isoform X2 [Aphidius gifuensis]